MTARPHTQGHTPQQSMQRDAAPDISAASLSFCPVPHRLFTHCGAVADVACSDDRCSTLRWPMQRAAMADAACCILRPDTKPGGEEGIAPPHRVQKKPESGGMHHHGFWPSIILKTTFLVVLQPSPSYYREIAPLGQASAHVPHSVHSSGLIEYFSPSEIAPTGHSSIHVPHATQSSPITYAIIFKFYMFIEYLFLLCLQR